MIFFDAILFFLKFAQIKSLVDYTNIIEAFVCGTRSNQGRQITTGGAFDSVRVAVATVSAVCKLHRSTLRWGSVKKGGANKIENHLVGWCWLNQHECLHWSTDCKCTGNVTRSTNVPSPSSLRHQQSLSFSVIFFQSFLLSFSLFFVV